MTYIDRLMCVGMPQECAEKIVAGYIAQGDVDGLEDYVIALETSHEAYTLQSQSGPA